MANRVRVRALFLAGVVVVAACSSGAAPAARGPAPLASPSPADLSDARVVTIASTDSPATIIRKAGQVRPSANLLAWHRRELTALIHFGPNTFTNSEWGSGAEDPDTFSPTALDTDQWARTLKAAGFTMAILTVKHHDGFLLYPSRYTDYTVASSRWEGGHGDVLRSFVDSARKVGLAVGVFLSPADLHESRPGGTYGNGSAPRRATIPEAPISGPRPAGPTFSVVADDYNRYYLDTLYEVLTEYGRLDLVFFDGANPGSRQEAYDNEDWVRMARRLQPHAVLFGAGDVRWAGNENGIGPTTDHAVTPDPTAEATAATGDDASLGARDGKGGSRWSELRWRPLSCDASMNPLWFWHATSRPKALPALLDMYETSVGRGCPLMLGVAPDPTGRIDARQATSLADLGAAIRSVFGHDLASGAKALVPGKGTAAAAALTDDDPSTSWGAPATGGAVALQLARPTSFDDIGLQEDIGRGQRVSRFAVDAWVGGAWTTVAHATTIGYRRIIPLDRVVTTSRVRLRVLAARGPVSVSSLSLYRNVISGPTTPAVGTCRSNRPTSSQENPGAAGPLTAELRRMPQPADAFVAVTGTASADGGDRASQQVTIEPRPVAAVRRILGTQIRPYLFVLVGRNVREDLFTLRLTMARVTVTVPLRAGERLVSTPTLDGPGSVSVAADGQAVVLTLPAAQAEAVLAKGDLDRAGPAGAPTVVRWETTGGRGPRHPATSRFSTALTFQAGGAEGPIGRASAAWECSSPTG